MIGNAIGNFVGGRRAGFKFASGDVPSDLTLTALSDTSIKADWTINATTHEGHKVYISTDNVTFTLAATVTGSTSTATIAGLTAGVLYYVRVCAYKGSVNSDNTDYGVIIAQTPLVLLQDFDDIVGFTTENTANVETFELSTDRFIDGNAALKFKTNDVGSAFYVFELDPPVHCDGNAFIRRFRGEDRTGSGISLLFSTVYPPTYAAGTFVGSGNITGYEGNRNQSAFSTGWNNVVFTRSGSSWSGTATLLDDPDVLFTSCRIGFPAKSTGPDYFDSLRIGALRKATAVITFDDQSNTIMTPYDAVFGEGKSAFDYMAEKNILGTIYVIGQNVGNIEAVNSLTVNQLNAAYEAGWDLGNHSQTHKQITGLTDEQIEADLALCDAVLAQNGWERGRKHFAYPGGSFTLDAHPALIKSLGFKTARTINPTGVFLNTQGKQSEADNLFNIWSFGVSNLITAANRTDKIDEAITTGRMFSMYVHALATPESTANWDPAKFKIVIDHLATKRDAGLIEVLTISQWYKLMTNE